MMYRQYFYWIIGCLLSTHCLFAEPLSKSEIVHRYIRELHQVLIIPPDSIEYFGVDYVLKSEKEEKSSEAMIFWVKTCLSEEPFINKLQKIIKATNLKIPIYVTPEAGLAIIRYCSKKENTELWDIPDAPLYNNDLRYVFDDYKKRFGIKHEITEIGIIFSKENSK